MQYKLNGDIKDIKTNVKGKIKKHKRFAISKTGRVISSRHGKICKIEKKKRVVVSPVFKTKEQEKLFAECAAKSMSIDSYLKW